uniref:VPS13 middle RBG modules domain-containing protein n=1 Tax=Panagrolaimus sp. ES5 TaxID=591445 RepID=A0AC34GIZ2_9BILA
MAAYDKFQFKLSNIQVIFADDFGKAMSARNVKDSPYHVLKPTGLDIAIHKSSIEDLSMPKLRVFGDLPDIIIHISDKRLIALLKLALSIPLPTAADSEPMIDLAAPTIAEPKAKDRAKMKAIMEVTELEETDVEVQNVTSDETQPDADEDKEGNERNAEENKRIREQQVQIDVNLKLNQIGVYVYRGEQQVVNASLRRFGCQFQMRTFDLVVKMHLGSLTVEQPEFKNLYDPTKTLFVIDNPLAE